MKKTIILLVAFLSLGAYAQHGPQQGHKSFENMFTPQQNATLKAKRMALHLDLNEAQQQKVYNLILKQEIRFKKIKTERKLAFKKGIKPTNEQRFNDINKSLDAKLNFQKRLKNILNEKQYAEFKNGIQKRMALKPRKMNKKFKKYHQFKRSQKN